MAKKMRRVLALLLALTLCAGQVILPAHATEAESSVTTTEIEGGTQTVTVSVDSSGSQTTTTEVSTSNPDTGTSTQSTTTEVVSSSGGGSQTSVDTTWESTTTEVSSSTQTSSGDQGGSGDQSGSGDQTGSGDQGSSGDQTGNTTIQTDTNITTTVTGSENTTTTTTVIPNDDGEIQKTEGTNKGEETTTTTGTTVTTTTTTDVLISDEDSSTTETIPVADPDPINTSTGWQEGEVTEGRWQEGQVQEGDTLKTTGQTSKTNEIEATNPGKATIEMKPDGSTEEVKVTVTIDQVLAGVPIPEGAVEVKKNGKVIGYKVVTVTETSKQDPKPDVGDTEVTYSEPIQKPTAPKGYKEGTVTEGNVTTVTEAIRDDSNAIIGYRVTKTTVTEDNGTTTTESTKDTTTETTTDATVHTLPERPEESETTDENGYVVRVQVEDILEGDKVVGYKTTTTYSTSEGETLRTESNSIYGTTSSSSTQVQKDPETEVETVKTTITKTEVNEIYSTVSTREATLVTERTNNITTTIVTEEDTYQLVETNGGLFFLYKGTMKPVMALTGHGAVALTGLEPTATPSSANDLASFTSVTNPPTLEVDPGKPGSDQFKYVDYGLISDFRVTKADGYNTSEVHLYKLVDKWGNPYYAYCADMDTTAYRKTIYDISNAKDENYYQNNTDQKAYDHLQAIAINGYWGTSSGTGSIAEIKTLLDKDENRAYLKNSCGYTDAQIDSVINSLTDGEAMTATQAAIWTFGNKSSTKLVNTNNPAANVSDRNSRRNIEILYDLLISETLRKNTQNTETDIITEQDISGATLELKGHATDSDGEVKTDKAGNKKYNTDLTFTMSVEESALTGNLKVVVKDSNDNVLREEQLLTENSNFLGKALADGSGYSYTIENLEIAEGVTINLNLEGYQNLKKGVYIYTAATGSHEDSQTFIGISEGKRDVKLQTQLTFTVEDPKLKHVEKTTTQTRKDTRVDRKEDHRTDTKEDTQETGKITVTVVTDTNVKTYGTQTVTETKQDITKEERSWEGRQEYSLQVINGEDGGSDQSGGEEKTTKNTTKKTLKIIDELVPLAKAPKTGDLSGLWLVVSGLSLGGMALLNAKRKEEE